MTLASYMRERVSVGGLSSCWDWQGHRDRQGYGKLSGQHGGGFAHRAFYELRRDPIPQHLTLDHLCRNRACCNPRHLEVVTAAENILRGASWSAQNARKTHCPQGHPYDEENTYVTPAGRRACVICHREQSREGARRRRAKARAQGTEDAQAKKGTGI